MKTTYHTLLAITVAATALVGRTFDHDIFDRETVRQHYLEVKSIMFGIHEGQYLIGSPAFEEDVKTYLNFYLHRAGVPQFTEIVYVDPQGTDPDAWNLDFPSGFQPNFRPVAIPFGEPTDLQDEISLTRRARDNIGAHPDNPNTLYLSESGINDLYPGDPGKVGWIKPYHGPKGKRFEGDLHAGYISDAGYMAYSEFAPQQQVLIWNVSSKRVNPDNYRWNNYINVYLDIDWNYHDNTNPEHLKPIWDTADVEITLDGVPIPLEEFRLLLLGSMFMVGFQEGSPTALELSDRPYHDRVLKFSFKNIPTLPDIRTMDWEYYVQEGTFGLNSEPFAYVAYHPDDDNNLGNDYIGEPVGGSAENGLPNQRITGFAANGWPLGWEILDENGNVIEVIENKATKVVYEDIEWTTIIYDEYSSDGRPWHQREGYQVIANLGLVYNSPSDDGKSNWFYLSHPSFEGWYWTQQGTWPTMYSAQHQAWLWWGVVNYYDPQTGELASSTRDSYSYTYFYNFTAGQWEVSEGEFVPANSDHPRAQWLDLAGNVNIWGHAIFAWDEHTQYNQLVVPVDF